MRQRRVPVVPVTMGSPSFRSRATANVGVTEAWFPPHAVLAPHTHDRTIFAVMVEGSFETAIAGRRLDCTPAVAWTEPCEERHANYIGAHGAHVVIVQPDPARQVLLEPLRGLTDAVNCVLHAGIVADARRIAAELRLSDDLSGLAIDALALGMMAAAARLTFARRMHEPPPAWLLRAQELLHEHFRRPLQIGDTAAAVGVHPSHLAHVFRRHFRSTIGDYVRGLRLTWALERLIRTRESISEIAFAAGYSDQSHFTRACRNATGFAPARYRRLHVD